jgi:hypothetical protein
MNSSTKIDVSNYSFNELKKCIPPFTEYKQENGSTQPVDTGYSFIDNSGNWLASCLGFKTNQKFVAQILEILNGAEKEYKDNRAFTQPFVVYNTLSKIKKIYDEMIQAGIKSGKTIDALDILFGHFNYPYKENGSKYDELSSRIYHLVKDLHVAPDDKESENLFLQSSTAQIS